MKLSDLQLMLGHLGEAHPDADVRFWYPARHAGRDVTRGSDSISYSVHMRGGERSAATVRLLIEHPRGPEMLDRADDESLLAEIKRRGLQP